ncbi:endoglucanase 9-like isoform X5 [Magnolia sinica]|uniref:endoglucanase 9-like isoform X5 n=1 Tax=Magnolia sinica TaxID=86752 RepID=UPI002657F8D3|nr:endoglucanase 9-like isoform X5 [Magnolia sinica]
MAFTITMLSWSALEFPGRMPDELDRVREAVRWGTDYLLKASTSLPDALYVQVGDSIVDHKCWQRPEDMDTPRTAYKVTPSNPGSEVAAETAAAFAAASLVFKKIDRDYSKTLLRTAKMAFTFANENRGNYNDSLPSVVCPFYCSHSGYHDELLWGSAWLYKATRNSSYLDFARSVLIDDDCDTFSWDNKLPGARVLLSRVSLGLVVRVQNFHWWKGAERFACSILPESPTVSVKYTPGGLMYKMKGSNLQYVTSSTFLLSTYARYLKFSDRTFKCGSLVVTPILLRKQAKKQVDYILGENPKRMSYMVGFGDRFPRHIHHRASSLPSIQQTSAPIGCNEGFTSLNSPDPNPNILTGAIVGGPDLSDEFEDNRHNFAQSEPATYINAALIGPLSYLAVKFPS